MTGLARFAKVAARRRVFQAATLSLAAALAVVPFQEAAALITGGVGNGALADPGWPKGAASLFNNPARIAWWEGPPFGGGQWHAECRGDAKAFNEVLAAFAKLDVKTKKVVVHDGVGHSFWLNPNNEPEKHVASLIDWRFMVWQPASWERLRKLPADLNPTDPGDAAAGPPSQIDVYAGGDLRWPDVIVPKGIEVVDERLEAHGFTLEDGVVLEGKVVDLATNRPIAARVRLQRVEPQPKGGYLYPVAIETVADAQGRWVVKKAPEGWFRVVVEADGYVPRVPGYARFDDQPRWESHDCGLLPAAPVSGRVTDDAGKPLAGVEVRIGDVTPKPGGRYQTPDEQTYKTDADGRFRADRIPAGRATIWLSRSGYCRPGLGLSINAPNDKIVLEMKKSARIRVSVDFTAVNRPEGYIVQIQPEGGDVVGSWGGSGNIDAQNQISFNDIPPGRYILQGRPNPSGPNQQTEPVTIDLKGGETAKVALIAR